jgi:predicted ATPase
VPFSSEGDHTPYTIRKQLGAGKKAEFQSRLKAVGIEGHLFDSIHIHRFGNDEASPFEVQIEMKGGQRFPISNVGYGVSQVLPIVVEAIIQSKGARLLLQQPEVHLHPRAQAAVGDLIYTLVSEDQKRFVVETHSDFLIDRFRLAVARSESTITASVLFFSHIDRGNQVTELRIDDEGKYPNNQPAAFREFFVNEQLSLLESL